MFPPKTDGFENSQFDIVWQLEFQASNIAGLVESDWPSTVITRLLAFLPLTDNTVLTFRPYLNKLLPLLG